MSVSVLHPATGAFTTPKAWQDYLAGLAFLLWNMSILAHFWTLDSWFARVEQQAESAAFAFQFAGLMIFLGLILVSRGFTIVKSEFIQCQSTKSLCMTAIFGLVIFHSIASTEIKVSLAYAVITWIIFVFSSCFWQGSLLRIRAVFVLLACVITVYLGLLALHHGLSQRTVGGIQPNMFGKSALIALVCFFFADHRARWLGVAVCVGFMQLVSSRSSLVAAAVFIFGYYSLRLTASRLAIVVVLAFGILSAAELGALAYTGAGVFEHLSREVLLLDDPGRGLGSGFTGRADRWASGLMLLADRPLTGYGFRASPIQAHNGYINLALDVGLIIALLITFLFVGDAVKRAILARSWTINGVAGTEPEWREAARVNAVAAAFIVTSLFLWLLEPAYLNIGFVYSLLFILFFSAPYAPPLAKPRTNMATI